MQPKTTKNIWLLSSVMLFPSGIYAADGFIPHGRPDFLTMKQETIVRLKTELTCVEAAKDDAALRSCRPKPPPGGIGGPANQSNSVNGVITEGSNKYNLPEF